MVAISAARAATTTKAYIVLNNTLLYNTYLKWCTKNNERANSQKWLSMRMQEKGFKRMVTNSQRVWVGLVLREEWRL